VGAAQLKACRTCAAVNRGAAFAASATAILENVKKMVATVRVILFVTLSFLSFVTSQIQLRIAALECESDFDRGL
jgi:hypothetical protein